MNSIFDLDECKRDSPKFRQWLNCMEKNFFNVESRIEKAVKQCVQVVSSGRGYISEQEQMIGTLSELSSCFSQDPLVFSSVSKLIEYLTETISYQQSVIDQTNHAVAERLSCYIKSEVKHIKEIRLHFEKSGNELDCIIHKVAGSTKLQDSEDLYSQLVKVRKAFRHSAIDYAKTLSLGQERSRYETLFSTLSHSKASATFYHQGIELCNDFAPTFNRISQNISDISVGLNNMEKETKNIHCDISGEDVIPSSIKAAKHITNQGYLFKRSTNAFKTWNYRYFVLEFNKLLYQKRSGEEVTIMEEDLRLCNVRIAADVDRKFCFEVTSNAKTHLLQAESEIGRKQWIDTLNEAIRVALSDDSLSIFDYEPLNQSGSPEGEIRSKSSIESPRLKTNALQRILQVRGNDFCCDCDQPNPKWSSINLGITLCIECSGIHRSMGVHISKVRSLTLDHWDDEVISVMEELGNSIVNEIYLANYVRDLQKATGNCERSIRETWIKSKYKDKKFVISFENTSSLTKMLSSIQDYRSYDEAMDCVSLDSISKSSINENEASMKVKITKDDREFFNPHHMCKLSANEILLRASELAHLPLMLVSLSMGADKNCRSEDGKFPIHHAVLKHSSAALEFLLQNGVAIKVTDNDGKSPLHLAAMDNNIVHVYRLIIAKADHNQKDNIGNTALDLAIQTNEPNLVTLLRMAVLGDELDKNAGEEEMKAIMKDICGKRLSK